MMRKLADAIGKMMSLFGGNPGNTKNDMHLHIHIGNATYIGGNSSDVVDVSDEKNNVQSTTTSIMCNR